MQAVILVGGEGTRLRPLTSNMPKPIVPLVDRPFMAFMLEWLRRHDVDDVVMSCGFLATAVKDVLGDGSRYGLRLRFVEEPDPRGTAGALKYAEDLLDERFLMLNGDVLTDIDLTAQIAQHAKTGATGTLALVPVEDPSAYGLVRLHSDHAVREFVEKPSADQIDTNLISAGAYVLERSILDDVAKDQNASSATASTASRPRPTGSTSGRPTATCRAPSTSSRARSTPPSARAWASSRRSSRRARPSPPTRTSGRSSSSATA